MLSMPTGQLGNPVAMLVLMEAGDGLCQLHWVNKRQRRDHILAQAEGLGIVWHVPMSAKGARHRPRWRGV
jgi:hypothetical protein